MTAGSKVRIHDIRVCQWMNDFLTRPDRRKTGQKSHDFRKSGRIVKAGGKKYGVRYFSRRDPFMVNGKYFCRMLLAGEKQEGLT